MVPRTMTASRWAGRLESTAASSCESVAARLILSGLIVRYGNGTQEEIAIRSRIPDGGQTRVIDLPGERRIIQNLDLWYSRDKWGKRPKVSLYGLRD